MRYKALKKMSDEEKNCLAEQLGKEGLELLHRLEAERLTLKRAEYPFRDSLMATYEAIAIGDESIAAKLSNRTLEQLIADAKKGGPMGHEVLLRVFGKLRGLGKPFPPALLDYLEWFGRSDTKAKPIGNWLETVERDHLAVWAMGWLVARGRNHRDAAGCVADIVRHFGVRGFGADRIRQLWMMEKLSSRETALLGQYDRQEISFKEYQRQLSLGPQAPNDRDGTAVVIDIAEKRKRPKTLT